MTIAYDRTGDGPPLVLLHPLGADRRVWDPIVGALSTAHDVIALDLPGFGESPPLRDVTPTPRALAGAVATLTHELGLQRPHMVGNSLGGWVALELGLGTATNGPTTGPVDTATNELTSARIDTVTAGCVTAIAPAGLWAAPLEPKPNLTHRLARALTPLIEPAAMTRPGRRLLLSGSVAHPDRVPPRDAVHLIRAYARAPGFIAVNDAMRAGRFTALDRIRCPVTLIWPEHDGLVKRPATLPTGITSLTLADAGHIPIWDAPAELAKLIAQADRGADASAQPINAA